MSGEDCMSGMRKWSLWNFLAVLISLILLAPLVAAQTRHISIDDYTACPPGTIDVPVHLDDGSSVVSIDLTIVHDPTVLEYAGASKTPYSDGMSLEDNEEPLGTVKIALFDSDPLPAGPGDIIMLHYNLLAPDGRQTALEILGCNEALNEGSIPSECSDGSVTLDCGGGSVRRLSADDYEGCYGDILDVPIHLDDGTDVTAVDLTVVHDPLILEYLDAETTAYSAGFSLESNEDPAGTVSLALFDSDPLPDGPGDVVVLSYKIVGQSEDRTDIDLQGCDEALNEGSIPAECDDGSATVSASCPCPDADEDGYPACDGQCDPGGNECDCDDADASTGSASVWYQDADADGYGDPDESREECEQPDGYVANGDDCDDSHETANPGNSRETSVAGGCEDGVDNDCDGSIDSADSEDCSGSSDSFDVSLGVGWTLVGPALDVGYTARDMCRDIEDDGGSPTEIVRWTDFGWDSHPCELPGSGFPIEAGAGYFVRADAESLWSQEGPSIPSPLEIPLGVGWTLTSLPAWQEALSARDACDSIEESGGSPEEIVRWTDFGWDSHPCALPGKGFDMVPGQGYFVRSTSASVWTLSRGMRVTNTSDHAFSTTWTTEVSEACWIEYGTTGDLGARADDVRGSDYEGMLHYVDLTGLSSDTVYYYDLVCVSSGRDNNGGEHYMSETGPTLAVHSPDSAYGQVTCNGEAAVDVVVCVRIEDRDSEGSAGRSTWVSDLILADDDGWWNVNVSNARTADLASYFEYSAVDVEVQEATNGVGGDDDQEVLTSEDEPSPEMSVCP